MEVGSGGSGGNSRIIINSSTESDASAASASMKRDEETKETPEFTIFLSISDSERVAVEVSQDATASQFRAVASAATDIPLSRLKLIFRGRIIHDDNTSGVLHKHSIEDGRVVHCLGRPVKGLALKTDTAVATGEVASASCGHAAAHVETAGSIRTCEDPLSSASDKSLVLAVHNEHWEEVRKFLSFGGAARRLAEYRDDTGQTALHYATARDTPMDILRSLVSIYPEAILRPVDRRSSCPLLLSTKENMLRQMLEACPQVLSVTDDSGDTVLHHILRCFRRRWTHDMVRDLLLMEPTPIHVQNKKGETPLHLFFSDSNWREGPLSLPMHGGEAKSDDDMVETSLHLLRAYLPGRNAADDDTAPWLELHASIRADGCPWSRVLDIFLRRYRQQCTEKDERGMYPLHLICASNKARDAYWRSAVREILQGNSGSASEEDSEGNLPLHLFLSAGASFEEGSLENVFNSFPEALSVKNRRGHTPFHVALLGSDNGSDRNQQQPLATDSSEAESEGTKGKGDDEREVSSINSIFWLLKKDPSAIDAAICWESGGSRKKMRK